MVNGITPLLWVDTQNGNIERYFDRYIEPLLKADGRKYNFNRQKKELKFNGCTTDFRSADIPQNIEGFGYKKIFLNEPGIILTDDYLYTNSILPMLLDFPDSQLIAVGVPKGQVKKDGNQHLFYKLFLRGKSGEPNFKVLEYTSYDSPFLNEVDIKELELEISAMNEQMVAQEIYGQFIEIRENDNLFFFNFDKIKLVDELEYDSSKQLLVSCDFNVNPITAIFANSYTINGIDYLDVIDEVAINNGDIEQLAEYILVTYPKSIETLMLTGDAMGNNRQISQRDNATLYELLRRKLNLRYSQLFSKSNPTHENSRTECNYFAANFKNFRISKNRCKMFIFDCKNVHCDRNGEIVKKNRKVINQRGDFLDCGRYLIHSFYAGWISNDMKKYRR